MLTYPGVSGYHFGNLLWNDPNTCNFSENMGLFPILKNYKTDYAILPSSDFERNLGSRTGHVAVLWIQAVHLRHTGLQHLWFLLPAALHPSSHCKCHFLKEVFPNPRVTKPPDPPMLLSLHERQLHYLPCVYCCLKYITCLFFCFLSWERGLHCCSPHTYYSSRHPLETRKIVMWMNKDVKLYLLFITLSIR